MVQTILGAGGSIGRELGKALPEFNAQIRWVSRSGKRPNDRDESVAADLMDLNQTVRAVEGSAVAYLVAGLTYNIRVWRAQWPVIMRNVIEACKRSRTKLVFFDNVYAYGKVDGWMTEDTSLNPVSRKGEVRAEIARVLMDEIKAGSVQAMIVRSADFHGAGALSFLNMMVYPALMKGKKATWLCNAHARHSFTYTPDAGRATALLGNTDTAYGQVWHLPTHHDALTGEQYVAKCAEQFAVPARYKVVGKNMMQVAGLFNPIVRESVEMLYQYQTEYLFDSGKFTRTFPFKPTPYDTAIHTIAQSFKS